MVGVEIVEEFEEEVWEYEVDGKEEGRILVLVGDNVFVGEEVWVCFGLGVVFDSGVVCWG